MRLYSYVVAHDTGFAPNPFWGVCSLATCKPQIRRRAQTGDWVIGTGSRNTVGTNKLVYAIKITRPPMSFAEYGESSEFQEKIPVRHSADLKQRCGDNIYYPDETGCLRLRPNDHHYTQKQMNHDLKGIHVLLSDHFFYFGREAITIPDKFLQLVKKGPSYKVRFPPDLVHRFLTWLECESGFTPGRHGPPYKFGLPPKCKCQEQRMPQGISTCTA